jgi:hypothetical protein
MLDMAWRLPAFGIAAAGLWRKKVLGYMLAGVLLSYGVFLVSAILGMGVSMAWEDQPVAVPQVVIFGVLLITALGMLIWYLKSSKTQSG